jgi:hypothetical protein
MICADCRVAADIITQGRKHDFGEGQLMQVIDYPIPVALNLRLVASLFHGKCKGSTHCDCQHIVDWSGNKTVQR